MSPGKRESPPLPEYGGGHRGVNIWLKNNTERIQAVTPGFRAALSANGKCFFVKCDAFVRAIALIEDADRSARDL